MFKKLKTGTLVVIFVLLFLAIALVFLVDRKEGGRTIREELVRMDTASVSSISLFPPAENRTEIKISKNGHTWIVQKEKVTADADEQRIGGILGTFTLLKPQRLAATERSQWKAYGVNDTLGTRMKFYSGSNLLADVVVGKFSYSNSTRSGISYIRLYGEDGVYAIDGFLAMAVNHTYNQWRNKTVLRSDKNLLTKISFAYPADTGFILSKDNGKWKIGSEYADSAKVEQFLNSMSIVNSLGFVDNYTPSNAPVITVAMEGNNMNTLTLRAFPADSLKRFVIHSSYNPSAYFSAREYGLDEKLFKGKASFLSSLQHKKKHPAKK